jgi:nitrate reductase gamma subunit
VGQVGARKWICEAAISNAKNKKMKITFGISGVLCVTAVTLLVYCW